MIHIKKLIILGGPPAVGKSHLIEQLQKGKSSSICAELQLNDPSKITFTRAQTLSKISAPSVDTLILHYDFLGPFTNGENDYDDKHALSVIYSAEEVVFVTLWVPPAVLSDRIYKRRVREKVAFLPKLLLGKEGFKQQLHKLHRFKNIQQLYNNPVRLTAQYEKWLNFCDKYFSIAHYIFVNLENEEHLIPLSEWNRPLTPMDEPEEITAL